MTAFFKTNIGLLFLALFLLVSAIAFISTFLIPKKAVNKESSCHSFLKHADIKKIKEDEAKSEKSNAPLSINDYGRVVSNGIKLRNEDHIKLVSDKNLAQTSDVEPVQHAHWIRKSHEWDFSPYFYIDFTCSNCNIREQDKAPYCRYCGAKMDEESKR